LICRRVASLYLQIAREKVMQTLGKSLAGFVCVIALAFECYAEATDADLVGQRVMVNKWDARLEAADRSPGSFLQLGDIYTVTKADGDRLQVDAGWLRSLDVVTCDEAIAFFTKRIDENPKYYGVYLDRAAAHFGLGELDAAITDETTAIGIAPAAAMPLHARGDSYKAKRDYERAIADFSAALRIDPKDFGARLGRGETYWLKQDCDRAIADFNEAAHINPDNPLLYCARADAWQCKGEYAKAFADWEQAIRLDANYADAYADRAWIWAVCQDQTFRDGKKAVESATKACQLDGWENADHLDTLAAAYAEAGDFNSVCKWETVAIASQIPYYSDKTPEDLNAHLELFKASKPYRELPRVTSPAN
jgi:tetratricopeptide (TPR) repeat protein